MTHESDKPEVDRTGLGYGVELVHEHKQGRSYFGPTYVNRQCDGCRRTLMFTPLPLASKPQWCSVCKRETLWEVVP